MQVLLLAHLEDRLALRVAASLRRRLGRQAVEIVSAEALALAEHWLHRLEQGSPEGGDNLLQVQSEIQLANGVWLRAGEIGVVFNRLRFAPAPQFASATEQDRDYASAELGALWLSWLASLQFSGVPVINPVGHGRLGVAHSRLAWLRLAAQAGLGVMPFRYTNTRAENLEKMGLRRCLAAGERAFWLEDPEQALHTQMAESIHALQHRSGCPLLEISFIAQGFLEGEGNPVDQLASEVGWAVVGVDPHPVDANRAGIAAIVDMLAGEGR